MLLAIMSSQSLPESAILTPKWIADQFSVSSLATAVASLLVSYLVWQVASKLWNELRILYWYRKLPCTGYVGIAGWILGNADVYYYYLSHIDRKKVAPQLLGAMHMLRQSMDRAQQYGMTRMELGFQRIVAFWEAEAIEELITSVVNIEKSEQYRFFVPWLGQGLFTSAADKWRQNRKLLTPAFHFNILKSFVPIMNENVQTMLSRIEMMHPKQAVDVRPFITDMTLDTICQTAMGVSVDAQADSTNLDYVQPLNTVLQAVMDRILNPILHLDIIFNRTSLGMASRKNLCKIDAFISKVIKEKKLEFEKWIEDNKLDIHKVANDDVGALGKKRYAFLDSLLITSMQNPNFFTENDIHDQVNTFMFGGHDTNSVSLMFSCLLIANDQKVQNNIVDELKSIFGEDKDRLITADDCREMKYLEMCIKESLRIYPPAPLVARKVTEDFTVRGHRIPSGCTCAIFIYLLHRNSKLFPQPERFIPERFEPKAEIHKMPYVYIPFSAGPRNCIGQKFAMLEMKIVLASILRRYQLTGITKRDQVDVEFSILLKPSSPIMIRFDRRND